MVESLNGPIANCDRALRDTGKDSAALLSELRSFAASLNTTADHVEKGRGTFGALYADPTVYEDLKTILGNIERNVVFKTLVRMTISNGDVVCPAAPVPLPPPLVD